MQGSKLEMGNQHLPDHNTVDQEEILPKTTKVYEDPGPYEISFVCLLIPRFEEHKLIGDLSEILQTWMRDICISYGWYLKLIDISPNFLHWIMTTKMTTSPLEFMNIIQKTTSKKIFEEFPRFSQQNVSEMFWAPYYYVGAGNAPYSKSTIQSFIDQIRMEQGLQ